MSRAGPRGLADIPNLSSPPPSLCPWIDMTFFGSHHPLLLLLLLLSVISLLLGGSRRTRRRRSSSLKMKRQQQLQGAKGKRVEAKTEDMERTMIHGGGGNGDGKQIYTT